MLSIICRAAYIYTLKNTCYYDIYIILVFCIYIKYIYTLKNNECYHNY